MKIFMNEIDLAFCPETLLIFSYVSATDSARPAGSRKPSSTDGSNAAEDALGGATAARDTDVTTSLERSTDVTIKKTSDEGKRYFGEHFTETTV